MEHMGKYPDCEATFSRKFTVIKRRRPYDGYDHKGTGIVHCDSCELRKIIPPVIAEDLPSVRESLDEAAEKMIYDQCFYVMWEEKLKNEHTTDIPQSEDAA